METAESIQVDYEEDYELEDPATRQASLQGSGQDTGERGEPRAQDPAQDDDDDDAVAALGSLAADDDGMEGGGDGREERRGSPRRQGSRMIDLQAARHPERRLPSLEELAHHRNQSVTPPKRGQPGGDAGPPQQHTPPMRGQPGGSGPRPQRTPPMRGMPGDAAVDGRTLPHGALPLAALAGPRGGPAGPGPGSQQQQQPPPPQQQQQQQQQQSVRYFVLRSANIENVQISRLLGVWATQQQNEARLAAAFRAAPAVYLFMAVGGRGGFSGFARMACPPGQGPPFVPWVGLADPTVVRNFRIEWEVVEFVAFAQLGGLTNSLNPARPAIGNQRDGQELAPAAGQALMRAIREAANRRGGPLAPPLDAQTTQQVRAHLEAAKARRGPGGGPGPGGAMRMVPQRMPAGQPPPPPRRGPGFLAAPGALHHPGLGPMGPPMDQGGAWEGAGWDGRGPAPDGAEHDHHRRSSRDRDSHHRSSRRRSRSGSPSGRSKRGRSAEEAEPDRSSLPDIREMTYDEYLEYYAKVQRRLTDLKEMERAQQQALGAGEEPLGPAAVGPGAALALVPVPAAVLNGGGPLPGGVPHSRLAGQLPVPMGAMAGGVMMGGPGVGRLPAAGVPAMRAGPPRGMMADVGPGGAPNSGMAPERPHLMSEEEYVRTTQRYFAEQGHPAPAIEQILEYYQQARQQLLRRRGEPLGGAMPGGRGMPGVMGPRMANGRAPGPVMMGGRMPGPGRGGPMGPPGMAARGRGRGPARGMPPRMG